MLVEKLSFVIPAGRAKRVSAGIQDVRHRKSLRKPVMQGYLANRSKSSPGVPDAVQREAVHR
jgi:hypothetical protein